MLLYAHTEQNAYNSITSY